MFAKPKQLNATRSSPQLGKHTPARITVTPPAPQTTSPQSQTPPLKTSPRKAVPVLSTSPAPPASPARQQQHPGNEYMAVPPELRQHIPLGSYVKYLNDKGKMCGGYVKSHHRLPDGWMTMIGSGLSEDTVTYPLVHAGIDTLWKKYSRECIIEIWTIRASLEKKRAEIEELRAQIAALTARLQKPAY